MGTNSESLKKLVGSKNVVVTGTCERHFFSDFEALRAV